MPTLHLPPAQIEQLRRAPIHGVLLELCKAARESKLLLLPEFKKLVAYLLELADGRDRREPWTQRPGVARPVPKLRVSLEKCFGMYADLQWFTINKITNGSGQPLVGLFPRMAASLSRVKEPDFASVVDALLAPSPDAALLRLLQDNRGKVKGFGVELFSRLAFALRRDMYFTLPKPWAETSGCMDYIGDDLRKYIGLCRNLRSVCDELDIDSDIQGSVLNELLSRRKPPTEVMEVMHKAIGPALAQHSGLAANQGYEPRREDEDESAMPQEFALRGIRSRRGRTNLREKLRRIYGNKCAVTGSPVADLLEAAYLVPYPTGNVHDPSNAVLVRSDIHTLMDLHLLGIDPATLKLHIAPSLEGTTYAQLAGRTLHKRLDGSSLDDEVLEERWRMFGLAHPEIERRALRDEAADHRPPMDDDEEEPDEQEEDRGEPRSADEEDVEAVAAGQGDGEDSGEETSDEQDAPVVVTRPIEPGMAHASSIETSSDDGEADDDEGEAVHVHADRDDEPADAAEHDDEDDQRPA